MTEWLDALRRHLLRFELALTVLLITAVFASVVLSAGGLELSSDSLNHHFYLGWVAESPRFDTDFLAASYQSYQWPYLYWPVYKLAAMGASGQTAGIVLALLHSLIVPPIWMLARYLMAGESYYELAMRSLAVVLAFASTIVLIGFRTTSNDLLAAIPMTWSIALAVKAFAATSNNSRYTLASGLLGGLAVAFKLSNGPIAILLPLLWSLNGPRLRSRLAHVLAGGVASILGFLLAYGYWGSMLWQAFGHPLFPHLR